MKIIQILDSVLYGNGVTKCMFMLKNFLDKYQYDNIVMAKKVDSRITEDVVLIKNVNDLLFDKEDIIIYHFCYGHELNYDIEHLPNRKILVYQNVTPPHFFRRIRKASFELSLWGVFDAAQTAGKYIKCITMSRFSKNDLVNMGWNEENISIIPLIELPEKKSICTEYEKREKVRILFTGRVAPNKKHEDIIKIFDYYNKNVNPNSELMLVGQLHYPIYTEMLEQYIKENNVQNVVFTGHVTNEELEEYYKQADIFLCMSEHEGLCLPLLEAMERQIPVIAYDAAAVPDTMGDAGILVDNKQPEIISKYIERLTTDIEYREAIIKKQNERLQYFRDYNIEDKLQQVVQSVSDMTEWKYKELSFAERYLSTVKNTIKSEILTNAKQVVIYGNGVLGKKLLADLSEEDKKKVVAICDNGSSIDTYDGIPVFKHEECMNKYPCATYIITPQKYIVEIINKLLKACVPVSNIKIYNSENDEII